MLGDYFTNPIGLLGLLALVPLILLYLLRPRPRKQTVPSLMFLMRDQKKSKYSSLFRIFTRDLLFFLQALAIIGFSLAAAQPYMTGGGVADTDAVIVLDDSASMHARTETGTRAQEAKEAALSAVGPKNTIVLAGSIPRIALSDADPQEARDFIDDWSPSRQPTRLTPALLSVQDIAQPGTRVIVISDFADYDDTTDYRDALQTIKARGYMVEAVQVGSPGTPPSNIGIIDLDITERQATAYIKNFGGQDKTIKACAQRDCRDITIPAGEIVPYASTLPAGITRISLDTDDAFTVDDEAFISTPTTREVRVLVVTNGDYENSYLAHALNAIDQSTTLDFRVETNTPPKLIDIDHDLIIFDDVSTHSFVTRTARDTVERVSAGSAAIIMYQDDVFALGLDDLLPLQYSGAGHATPVRNTQTAERLSGIDYGSSPTFHGVVLGREMQVLADADDATPLIAEYSIGQGRALWYGLPESASFSVSPDYPLFWRNAIDRLTGRASLESLNRRTGDVMTFSETARAPAGDIVEGRVLLLETGVYDGSLDIAVNLLDPKESSLGVPDLQEGAIKDFLTEPSQSRSDLTSYAIAIVLALLMIEVVAVKWRGDA